MSDLTITKKTPIARATENLYEELIKRLNGAPASTCPAEFAAAFIKLCHAQSCGKCVPCRIGFGTLSDILDRILDGKATVKDIDLLEKTALTISETADCVIGSEGAAALLTAIKAFREDFVSHIETDRCSVSFTAVPCSAECPAHIDIPGYIALTGAGRYKDAIRLIRKDNPFPSVCGLVCEHPCEFKCRRRLVDDAINIRGIKGYAMMQAGDVPAPEKYAPTGKKVAVIGGGPAGLTAAYYLSLMGHGVTVYEKRKKLGGMLRYGIPCYRLPDLYLDRDINAILSLGVEVKLGEDIGTEEFNKIKNEYDAVYISIGAHLDKKLGIDGEDKKGVMSAVGLLRAVGEGEKIDFGGKNVVVIGGGNVAMDATRTSVRLGAKSVTCVYRRRISDMTALPAEIEGAIAEGCEIKELAAPVRIAYDENDSVTGLVCQQQIIGSYYKGRPKPFKANTPEETIPCDIVIVAIGQAIDNEPFAKAGLPTKWDTIVANNKLNVEGNEKVFAGGDCVFGPETVIKAIEAGKVASNNIDKFLGFNTTLTVDIDIPAPKATFMPPCGRVNNAERMPTRRKGDFKLMEIPMSDEEARQECNRCLRCDKFGYGSFRGGRTNKW